jgi:hypothetical protein
MIDFKIFLENSEAEEQKNTEELISVLPARHQKLLHKFKITYTPKNTLKGDNAHIGYIYKNKIVVAAPWNYSRKFTTLHEIAHLVWEYLVEKKQKQEWSKIVKGTKNRQKQNEEELFCMAYGCFYSQDHCPRIHDHKEWNKFISKLS